MRLKLLLVSLPLLISSCVTIQDAEFCSPAGTVSNGAICSHLLNSETNTKTFNDFLFWLEAAPKTPTTPEKSAAICMSAIDFNAFKTELEVACRMLGKRCSLSTKTLFGGK
jgi:hypothetical protein